MSRSTWPFCQASVARSGDPYPHRSNAAGVHGTEYSVAVANQVTWRFVYLRPVLLLVAFDRGEPALIVVRFPLILTVVGAVDLRPISRTTTCAARIRTCCSRPDRSGRAGARFSITDGNARHWRRLAL
jgi:hypothetical protein